MPGFTEQGPGDADEWLPGRDPGQNRRRVLPHPAAQLPMLSTAQARIKSPRQETAETGGDCS